MKYRSGHLKLVVFWLLLSAGEETASLSFNLSFAMSLTLTRWQLSVPVSSIMHANDQHEIIINQVTKILGIN